jgi:hypothetical protein
VTRRTVPAAGLTAAVFILLTACGGSGGDKSSDKIKGADGGKTGTPAATASASATSAVHRPTITFPSGTKAVWEGQHTGDPRKDAVLSDNAQGVDSVNVAILEGKTHTSALEFYNTGKALGSAVSFIQGYLDKGDTWTGTLRYFNQKVTFQSSGSADVIYCSDETKAFLKDRKTGNVTRDGASPDDYVLYNTRLTKTTQGVWQTVSGISDRGAKECQP